jgi:hypothetical protein
MPFYNVLLFIQEFRIIYFKVNEISLFSFAVFSMGTSYSKVIVVEIFPKLLFHNVVHFIFTNE